MPSAGHAYGEGVRIRGVLSLIAAMLLLAGCGGQFGSGNEQSPIEAPRLKGLRVEVAAQVHDPCFRKPAELVPADCQKYITQLTSTPESAKKVDQAGPALEEAAQQLSEGIEAYRRGGCAGVTTESKKCTKALVTVADGLRAMHNVLETATE